MKKVATLALSIEQKEQKLRHILRVSRLDLIWVKLRRILKDYI